MTRFYNGTILADMKPLRASGVAHKLGIGTSTVYKYALAADFPRPFKLSSQVVVWDEADIDKWLEAKKGDSDEAYRSKNI